MRLIKPKVELINQEPGVEGLFKHMELCARTCYKSEDKITEDSAKKFINNVIIARGHTAMLEHGTVYLRYDFKAMMILIPLLTDFGVSIMRISTRKLYKHNQSRVYLMAL